MATTTIKVETSVRDRLAALAQERGVTMGALLGEVASRLEREAFFRIARAQLEQLRDADPGGWATDRAESRGWQAGTDRDALRGDAEPGWWE